MQWIEDIGNMDVVTSTSLDTIATSQQLPCDTVTTSRPDENKVVYPSCGYREYREREFPELLQATKQVLSAHDVVYDTRYLERMDDCRTRAWIEMDLDTRIPEYHSNSCRVRWCPWCAQARARFVAWECREFFKKQDRTRSLVLTVEHSDESLEDQVKLAGKWRAALCRSVVWKDNVTGCVWFLQIKYTGGDQPWHVHYHMLLTGSYVPQQQLSATWKRITGGSHIVHIRDVGNLGKALSDIARYAGRPANLLDVPFECQLELVDVTEKIRLVGTTGICTEKRGGIALHHKKKTAGESRKVTIGNIETYWGLVETGNENARIVLECADGRTPIPEDVSCWGEVKEIEGGFAGLSPVERGRDPPGGGQASFW